MAEPHFAVQIQPSRAVPLDQRELPFPQPSLDPLLTQDRLVDVWVGLVPDELMDAVIGGVTRDQAFLMLRDPPNKTVRYADVQPPARPAREPIDRELLPHHHPPDATLTG